jgi:mono/diheme cytochrome c family protein
MGIREVALLAGKLNNQEVRCSRRSRACGIRRIPRQWRRISNRVFTPRLQVLRRAFLLSRTGAAALLLTAVAASVSVRAESRDDGFFRDQVAPIFRERCVTCHGGKAPNGQLSLVTGETLRNGGASGPAVVPGKPDESLLLDMISGDEPEMPQKGEKLAPEQVARIRTWIEQGATWPRDLVVAQAKPDVTWWSLRPLALAAIPRVRKP